MYSEKIPPKQLWGWLTVAVAPVLIQYVSGNWTWVLLCATVGLAAVWIVGRHGKPTILGSIALLFVTGLLIKDSAQCWRGDNYPAVPLILLGLAAWSAWKGPAAAARTGCVLFWAVLVIYTLVIVSGLGEIDFVNLLPEYQESDWRILLLVLVPAAAMPLQNKKEKLSAKVVVPLILAFAASLTVAGVMSPSLAGELDQPFYEMSRSLDLFGIAKRFEAVISAAATVGWFSLMSLALSLPVSMVKQGQKAVVIGGTFAIAAIMLVNLHISGAIALIIGAVCWVIMPLLAQGIEISKKS